MYFSTILAFDHLRHRIHIIANIFNDRGAEEPRRQISGRAAAHRADRKTPHRPDFASIAGCPGLISRNRISNLSESSYYANVETAKSHIQAGDIFQVVLSQRFAMKICCDPFDIYRALRFINPSPYMFFLRMDNLHLVGASPEMLVKVRDGRVEYGPIAGTRPRGRTPEEDAQLSRELLADEKERAEHIMLVDLGRNDLGRVCNFGTVKVTDLMRIEKYSHVMHLVSSVEGESAARPRLLSCTGILSSRWNGVRGSQGARHGDHRGTGTAPAGSVWRCRGICRFLRESRHLHCTAHARHQRRNCLHSGRRRHCGGFPARSASGKSRSTKPVP